MTTSTPAPQTTGSTTTPAPAPSASVSGPSCQACAKCPATHYSHKIDVSGAAYSDDWPASDQFPSLTGLGYGPWHMAPSVLACSVVFPQTAQVGLLWHFGNEVRGASLGVRNSNSSNSSNSSTTPILRLRAGDSAHSSSNVAILDVTDFPTDGEFHEVGLPPLFLLLHSILHLFVLCIPGCAVLTAVSYIDPFGNLHLKFASKLTLCCRVPNRLLHFSAVQDHKLPFTLTVCSKGKLPALRLAVVLMAGRRVETLIRRTV